MLIQLLHVLKSGDAHSPGEIAQRMGIRVEMVYELMQQLLRLGYLEAQDPFCGSGGCTHCDIRGGCQTNAKVWSLTAKGIRVIKAA